MTGFPESDNLAVNSNAYESGASDYKYLLIRDYQRSAGQALVTNPEKFCQSMRSFELIAW